MKTIRIGTRQSQLALWQANHVRDALAQESPERKIELVKIVTEGDRILDRSLATVGGKGLFIKELEQALFDKRADLAVHSTKDVTVDLPAGLQLTAICRREDPRDAFVSNRYRKISELPAGARVGTASLRRQCQLRSTFPKLDIQTLRGNVNTRLAKLDEGQYDAIVLAAAGLKRLGLAARIAEYLDTEISLPAVGQGAVCIESRADDAELNDLLQFLDHAQTRVCVTAERAMNRRLEGGCQVPIAAYAELNGGRLRLRGLVGSPDGHRLIRAEQHGGAHEAERLGVELAEQLIALGAKEILDKVYGRS